jgi:hypothetical protein
MNFNKKMAFFQKKSNKKGYTNRIMVKKNFAVFFLSVLLLQLAGSCGGDGGNAPASSPRDRDFVTQASMKGAMTP